LKGNAGLQRVLVLLCPASNSSEPLSDADFALDLLSSRLLLRLDSWYIPFVMKRLLPFLLLLVVPLLSLAQDDTAEFRALIEKSVASTSLTTLGSQPFHLKLEAADSTKVHPEYKTELEVWWAAPDKWRRELKSPMFSETAVQNGQSYSESTSGNYLPYPHRCRMPSNRRETLDGIRIYVHYRAVKRVSSIRTL
jgi:hypothetical protein